MNCIVCNNQSAESFQTSDNKTYWKCGYCLAKFLDPGLYIEVGIEKERYLEHDNRIDDEAYRSFLSCLLYTSPSPRDVEESRMPSSA